VPWILLFDDLSKIIDKDNQINVWQTFITLCFGEMCLEMGILITGRTWQILSSKIFLIFGKVDMSVKID